MKLLSHILIPLAGTAMLTSCLSSVKPDGGHGVITFEPVVGAEVRARATLEKIDGRKLYFNVIALQGDKVIGEGTHLRFIVDRERFMAKL